ncbi:DNA polymerase III PolC-type [Rosistilla carotiformis]|uniref:DNA polymerase III PolC-type n=1 Tax=Rosistilla carotiformis TaxID=2528017 RepID=A0A518JLT5_9BACT|nr:exonuclease domain-containing protein [Rosistilla carotiformis]QDV66498.1 DNA polymerase III PolC-type [Rosistilla carotiformis]
MKSRCDGYAVVDVETTGFGKHDRVVEIGLVLLDARYRVVDEFETLIDPRRDLGPTHIHRITPAMVSAAPTFDEVAVAIARRIENRVLVAHNLPFDRRMLAQEFQRLGADFNPGLGVCTLKLTNQKLPVACQSLNLPPPVHHRALADARASASILKTLAPSQQQTPAAVCNVPGPFLQRTHRRCATGETQPMSRWLSRLVFDEGDTRLVQYIDLLDWALDDLELSSDEQTYLNYSAEELGLRPDEVERAHELYFLSMIAGAEKDGVITQQEHADLTAVASALGISTDRVPKPSASAHDSQDLVLGSAICFTGNYIGTDGRRLSKAELESMATQSGFTVVANVTKSKCDCVVAVDPNSSSGKAKRARDYGKPIVAAERFLEIVMQVNA